jgi:hypothetical protein
MENNNNEETGLFKKRFSYRQVFDCKREPLWPKKDTDFNVCLFAVPFNAITGKQIPEDELKNKIFYFEGLKGENDSIKKLSLWIADDKTKTNSKCIAENGSIYGLSPENFLFESEAEVDHSFRDNTLAKIYPDASFGGYGFYFSVIREFNYHGNDNVTWRSSIEKVTKFSVLEKYPFKEKE